MYAIILYNLEKPQMYIVVGYILSVILTIRAMLLQAALSASIGRSCTAAAAARWHTTSAIVAGRIEATGAAGSALCPEINLT